jgi:hypothetical protein
MIRGILFRQALEKFLKSPVAQNARVQVCLPNGEFYDIKEIRLLENKLIGVRETHRLVLTIEVKPLAPRDKKLDEVKLYEGSSILQLAACGLSLDACCSGLDACRLLLEELGA